MAAEKPVPAETWPVMQRASFLSKTFPTQRWFPKAPGHFQGQPCRPKDKIEGMQNEPFLINSTCKTEENLKISKVQERSSNLGPPSPRGLPPLCVKDNWESSVLRKKSPLLCPCSVYFGKAPSLWLVSYWKRLYL